MHCEVSEIVSGIGYKKEIVTIDLASFVNITYQTECSKNSACLYERWRERFQQWKEGSCLRSPQGCITSNIGIRKVEQMTIERTSSNVLDESNGGPLWIRSLSWKSFLWKHICVHMYILNIKCIRYLYVVALVWWRNHVKVGPKEGQSNQGVGQGSNDPWWSPLGSILCVCWWASEFPSIKF